jgi:hypothetical protein
MQKKLRNIAVYQRVDLQLAAACSTLADKITATHPAGLSHHRRTKIKHQEETVRCEEEHDSG